jgi:hypothetical protein
MRLAAAVAVLALLAGCGSAPSAPAAKPTAPARKATSKAVLESDGLIIDHPGGKTAEFMFGTSRTDVERVATRWLGQPVISSNGECGAGPMEFARYGSLTLNYAGGKFVGWLAEEGPQVVTADGIAPGKLMRDLKVARAARMIPNSTLEGEFEYIAADGHPIGGFVKGAGRDARIVSLYAGTNCFFR